MTEPRVIFVNRFYWPDEPATAQLLTDLAEGLVDAGFPVTVIARRPTSAVPLRETRRGVAIERVPTSRWGRHSLAGRFVDFASFLRGARNRLRQTLRANDIVVTLTDPPLLGPALRGTIKEAGARWVHWIQDIFPEVASAVSGKTFTDCLIPWRNQSWREADACVVPGADMGALVEVRGVARSRIRVSFNWAPAGLQPVDTQVWRARHGWEKNFVLMYSGNLGRVHDFSAIVPLARELRSDPNVLVVFVGDGARRPALEADVRAAKLNNVYFLPAQPRDALAETLSAGDLHVVTLRAGCESLVYPSKLYGIAAVGRPCLVIASAGAEVARTVVAAGFGSAFALDDIRGMAAEIRSLQSTAALWEERSAAARLFSNQVGQVARAVSDWRGVLDPLIPLAARPGRPPELRPTP